MSKIEVATPTFILTLSGAYGPTTTPGTPVAAVVRAAASPTIPVPVSAGCWPASKRGNSTYPFAKALVAANDSGNVPGKKTNTDTETTPQERPGNEARVHINWRDIFVCVQCMDVWFIIPQKLCIGTLQQQFCTDVTQRTCICVNAHHLLYRSRLRVLGTVNQIISQWLRHRNVPPSSWLSLPHF